MCVQYFKLQFLLCEILALDPCGRNDSLCEFKEFCHTDYHVLSNYFYCTCPPGMRLNPDNRTCSDIDECNESIGILHNSTRNETCVNIEITGTGNETQGYKCICKEGYEFNEIERQCLDVDECLTNCTSSGAVCINFEGGFNCSCENGYEWDGENCMDKDECLEENRCGNGTNCTANCTNTVGSYECTCDNGFYFTNSTCEDIDECASGAFSCSAPSMMCKNVPGGYNCSCNDAGGYDWYDFITKTCQSMLFSILALTLKWSFS